MSQKIDKIIREIEERTTPNQPILVVEGVSDPKALLAWLKNHVPTVEEKWSINPANGKQNVLDVLKEKAQWLGVVDRDIWSQEEIDSKCQQYPNLFVLPRWCIESYLIQPHELWQALTTKQQASITGGEMQFAETLQHDVDKYVRHGVLWSAVSPLWSKLRQLKFTSDLADSASIDIAQNDDAIQEVLKAWGAVLNPEQIFVNFQDKLRQVSTLPKTEQLMLWVHGKHFWRQSVCPALNKLLGKQQDPDARQKQLFQTLPFPDDLQPLLQRMQQWEIPQP